MSVVMVDAMSTSTKLLSLGSNTPTPSALYGAKMTLPLLAAAAPLNLLSVEMVDADVHQHEAVVARVEHSHAVRINGAKMTLPLPAVAAPPNLR